MSHSNTHVIGCTYHEQVCRHHTLKMPLLVGHHLINKRHSITLLGHVCFKLKLCSMKMDQKNYCICFIFIVKIISIQQENLLHAASVQSCIILVALVSTVTLWLDLKLIATQGFSAFLIEKNMLYDIKKS